MPFASEARGPGPDNSVQSVDRAVSILQVLGRRGAAGVTQLSTELGVHKSTISRLLSTLEARGLVEQTASRGSYRLGYGVVLLAEGASKRQDLSVTSRTVCNVLAEEVGETVTLAVREGRNVVTTDQVIGTSMLTTVDWVGQRSPLHVTAAGKVFLAHLPAAEVEAYLAGGLARLTDRTVTDPDALTSELATVRSRGYSTTRDEQEIGLTAVGAPIRGHDGRVVAALCVSGPSFRLVPEALAHIVDRLLHAAAQVSERNGYPKVG